MRFSTKCWSEHILSAYKATKDLKHPLYMTFKMRFDIGTLDSGERSLPFGLLV